MSILTIFLAMPGTGEMIMILIAILLLFGGKKIPELMRGIGKGIKDFKNAKDNVSSEIEQGMKDKSVKSSSPPPPPAAL